MLRRDKRKAKGLVVWKKSEVGKKKQNINNLQFSSDASEPYKDKIASISVLWRTKAKCQ